MAIEDHESSDSIACEIKNKVTSLQRAIDGFLLLPDGLGDEALDDALEIVDQIRARFIDLRDIQLHGE